MKRCMNCMEEYPDSESDTCPYCGYVNGATQDLNTALLTGTILQGRYIVGTVIKVRVTDVFYHGWDALFDRKVCIQEYLPAYLAEHVEHSQVRVLEGSSEAFQEGLKLFVRDSRELIRLYKEPDIMTVCACFEEKGTAYTIIECDERDTLEQYLAEDPVHKDTALPILRMAVQAVKKCHNLGVWHGMISPEAFNYTQTGLLLKDFAPWRFVTEYPDTYNTDEDSFEESCYKTDIHDLAALFYRIVTGNDYDEGSDVAADLRKAGADVDDYVVDAIEKALDRKTDTIDQFEQELCLSDLPRDDEPTTLDWEPPAQTESRKRSRRISIATRTVWALCLIAVLILIILIVIGTRQMPA